MSNMCQVENLISYWVIALVKQLEENRVQETDFLMPYFAKATKGRLDARFGFVTSIELPVSSIEDRVTSIEYPGSILSDVCCLLSVV